MRIVAFRKPVRLTLTECKPVGFLGRSASVDSIDDAASVVARWGPGLYTIDDCDGVVATLALGREYESRLSNRELFRNLAHNSGATWTRITPP